MPDDDTITEVTTFLGYDYDTHEPVELLQHIEAGGRGYNSDWNVVNENTIQALVGRKKGKGKTGGKVCFKCGQKGHIAKDCKSTPPTKSKGKGKSDDAKAGDKQYMSHYSSGDQKYMKQGEGGDYHEDTKQTAADDAKSSDGKQYMSKRLNDYQKHMKHSDGGDYLEDTKHRLASLMRQSVHVETFEQLPEAHEAK